jgi:hypothetical protein
VLGIEMKNNTNIKINVVNLMGQTVKTFEHSAEAGTNNIQMDLNGLSKGIYLVNVTAENNTGTKKLIIE